MPMNRMAPLIKRAATLRPLPMPASLATVFPAEQDFGSGWRSDLQFFVTAWLGGLLFVGTLLS